LNRRLTGTSPDNGRSSWILSGAASKATAVRRSFRSLSAGRTAGAIDSRVAWTRRSTPTRCCGREGESRVAPNHGTSCRGREFQSSQLLEPHGRSWELLDKLHTRLAAVV
jgi:hypothetical protein